MIDAGRDRVTFLYQCTSSRLILLKGQPQTRESLELSELRRGKRWGERKQGDWVGSFGLTLGRLKKEKKYKQRALHEILKELRKNRKEQQ